jgi:NAD(P)-dependent dehydrogenase (short-subunit alcohol dehydrogenase family)
MFGGDSFEIRLVVLGEPMGTDAMRLIEEGSRESACRITRRRPTKCWPAWNLSAELGEIRDIVEAVLFLEKASFVTGEILHVDGGQAAGHW